jgi:filamentous hemagglutinin family protein
MDEIGHLPGFKPRLPQVMLLLRYFLLQFCLTLAGLALSEFLNPRLTAAQLIPDNTLGAENSVVAPLDGLNDTIEGGATRGMNLFHSFREFNIGEGRSVYFDNPAGVENILTRVTGDRASSIMGRLGVSGSANLFLMNPNGLIFGENASLDVRGSFIGTTADSIQLGDNAFFSARDIQGSQLLAIQPGALFSSALSQHLGDIENLATLTVGAGESLTLYGGEVTQRGTLQATGGRVEVLGDRVSLLDNATIDVSSPTGGGTILVGGDYRGGGAIPTATQVFVDRGAFLNANATIAGDGGKVVVWADNNTQFFGTIQAQGGAISGNGGFVEVSGLNTLDFRGDVTTFAPQGEMGTLLLDPTDLTVTRGASGANQIDVNLINTATTNYQLDASNNITFDAPINITTARVGLTANAGNDIAVNQSIQTNGGDVILNAGGGIILNSGSQIVTGDNSVRQAGNVRLNAVRQVTLTNSEIRARSNNNNRPSNPAPQDYATVEIRASQGSVNLNNATISASNFGTGYAGDVLIGGRDRVGLENNSNIFSNGHRGRIIIGQFSGDGLGNTVQTSNIEINNSLLESRNDLNPTGVSIDSGDIFVRAVDRIAIANSRLETLTNTRGDAGRVLLETNNGQVALVNSLLSSRVGNNAIGSGGIIRVDTGSLSMDNSILLGNVASFVPDLNDPTRGGKIEVFATGDVDLRNSQIRTIVESGAFGIGGNIDVVARSLFLQGSQILSGVIRSDGRNRAGVGVGGNIRVVTSSSVLISGRDSAGFASGLFASTEPGTLGFAGDILVRTSTLLVTNGGVITASGLGTVGSPGNILIIADAVGIGRGGSISAASLSGENANISLILRGGLIMWQSGRISTQAFNDGNGGNINVRGAIVFTNSFQNSDIIANAFRGRGGSIFIDAPLYRGFRNTDILTPNSDVTASSEFGVNGNTTIEESLGNLPQAPIEQINAEALNQDVCELEDGLIAGGSSFSIVGSGGLPTNPLDTLVPLRGVVEWASVPEGEKQPNVVLTPRQVSEGNPSRPIQQAQGWKFTPEGKIELVATAPSFAGASYPSYQHPNCQNR